MLPRIKTVISFIVFALIVFFVFETLSYKIISGTQQTGKWDGYYQLVYNEAVSSVRITSLLVQNGFTGLISEGTEKVSVFDFGKNKVIPLTAVSDYFETSDPLYDPYLKKLGGYFKGLSGKTIIRVLYIPAEKSPLLTYLSVRKALIPLKGSWTLINFQPLQQLFLGILIFAAQIVLFILSGRNKQLFIFSLLPWLFLYIFGGFQYAVVSVGFQFLWMLLLKNLIPHVNAYLDFHRIDMPVKYNILKSSIFFLIVFMGTVFIFHDSINLLVLFISLFLQVIGAFISLGIVYFKHRYRLHKLFYPIVIKEKWKCLNMNELSATGILFIILLVAPLFYRIPLVGQHITLAVPCRIPHTGELSFKNLKMLYSLKQKNTLPDLSNFLCHRAYIEGYPYGRPYTFPAEGSSLSFFTFKNENGMVRKENSTIKLFTDSWYKSIIASVDVSSIPALLLKQRFSVAVDYVHINSLAQNERNLKKYFLFYLFLLIPFLFWVGSDLSLPKGGIKHLFVRRRRQVV